MATVSVTGSTLGTALQQLLDTDEIVPGAAPSYELCKQIYAFHPLGAKMVDAPIEAAQSQSREVTVPAGPEERVRDAFLTEWAAIGADEHIANLGRMARIYGIASIAVLTDGKEPGDPLDLSTVWKDKIAFNVLDPLNTAGSLVLNQDPNALDFQKYTGISVAGKPYARNRAVVLMNERPLYIEYTPSAFGFVGRSVYQRPLFPLKSFVQTMVTDDMVSKKAGLIIAFIKGAGSVIDNLMAKFAGIKRSLLKIAVVDNVLSMGPDDKVESLDLTNLDGAYGNSRTNILKNIATAAKMPAVMLENETLTEGFGEGTEDAKVIAQFVDGIRKWLGPAYSFFDTIVQRRAWNPDFIKIMKKEFPEEFGGKTDDEIFLEWRESFHALWPSLLKEPESEEIKVEDVKFKALLATAEVLGPQLDPENKATLLEWVADNLNSNKLLFGSPLVLDMDLLRAWTPQDTLSASDENDAEAEASKAAGVGGMDMKLDSAGPGPRRGLAYYEDAVRRLPLKVVTGGRRNDAR